MKENEELFLDNINSFLQENGIGPCETSKLETFYHMARKHCLQICNWPFSIKRAVRWHDGSPVRKVHNIEEYCYEVPDDYLMLKECSDKDFSFLGKLLLSEKKKIEFSYIADIKDTTLFTKDFIKMVTLKVAEFVAYDKKDLHKRSEFKVEFMKVYGKKNKTRK